MNVPPLEYRIAFLVLARQRTGDRQNCTDRAIFVAIDVITQSTFTNQKPHLLFLSTTHPVLADLTGYLLTD